MAETKRTLDDLYTEMTQLDERRRQLQAEIDEAEAEFSRRSDEAFARRNKADTFDNAP
jgi:predicted  nucleic acid-binding Zn-ribbon protein